MKVSREDWKLVMAFFIGVTAYSIIAWYVDRWLNKENGPAG